MSVRIESASVQGAGGEPSEGEELTAYAQVANEGAEQANLNLHFHIDGSELGTVNGTVDPGGNVWLSASIGHLTAGGHELRAVADVDDGQSSSQADNGISFMVAAPAPPPNPTVQVGEIHFQPHTNVEHPAGHAWSNEQVQVSVLLHNTGTVDVNPTVTVSGGGQVATATVELPVGAQQWAVVNLGPFPAGAQEITATASAETQSQSVLLGHNTATLTVTDPATGYAPTNVQVTLHDFRGRPMEGRAVFLQFYGMDGTEAGGAETVDGTTTSGGVLTRPGITIPPRGTVRIMAVSTGEADEPIEASATYHLADGQHDLAVTAEQESSTAKVTATSLSGVRDQLSGEMHAGLEIEVLTIGGSVATQHEESQQHSTAVEWEVRYGRPSFRITVGAN